MLGCAQGTAGAGRAKVYIRREDSVIRSRSRSMRSFIPAYSSLHQGRVKERGARRGDEGVFKVADQS